jgi:hypothetical protein
MAADRFRVESLFMAKLIHESGGRYPSAVGVVKREPFPPFVEQLIRALWGACAGWTAALFMTSDISSCFNISSPFACLSLAGFSRLSEH